MVRHFAATAIKSYVDAGSPAPSPWAEQLDARQLKEIEFARIYAKDFAHGTDGHHRLLLIAKLADLLDGKA